jgi:hypothetical protein
MNEACTFLPAAAAFFELARAELFGVTAFAFFAMSSVELESHTDSAILKQLARYCTLKMAFACILLILNWR